MVVVHHASIHGAGGRRKVYTNREVAFQGSMEELVELSPGVASCSLFLVIARSTWMAKEASGLVWKSGLKASFCIGVGIS